MCLISHHVGQVLIHDFRILRRVVRFGEVVTISLDANHERVGIRSRLGFARDRTIHVAAPESWPRDRERRGRSFRRSLLLCDRLFQELHHRSEALVPR